MPKKPSLAETHPELAKQWHPTKNGDLKPYSISKGSSKIIWFSCNVAPDHIWKIEVRKRTHKKSGCPFCEEKKASSTYNLKKNYPEASAKWDFKLNENLFPENFSPKSNLSVWWKCNSFEDHPSWKKSIRSQIKNDFCPTCKSFGHISRHLLKFWDYKKNIDLDPFKVTNSSGLKVWWCCEQNHSYQMKIHHKSSGIGCPVCSGRIVSEKNSLFHNHRRTMDYWDYEKNKGINPKLIARSSTKVVYWKCAEADDHKWKQRIDQVAKNKEKCPYCNNFKTTRSNSLKEMFPDVYNQILFSRHDNKILENLNFKTSKKIWFICPKGDDHIWKASVYHRTINNSGCPVCENLKVVKSNSLTTTDPKVSAEWHPTKNGKLSPETVNRYSNKKVWFRCNKNFTHEWKTFIYHRTVNESNCPYCTLTPQSRQELIITFELLKFFKNINPKGYKTRLNGKLRAIDIFIPDLNLAIEFDGSYWHKGRRAIDKIKSEMLMVEGYQVIRIREQPLKKIHENDIISKLPYNGKEITDNILKRILELYQLKDSMKRKIQNYISKDGIQNEKALDKYIDQILEEKAAKKK